MITRCPKMLIAAAALAPLVAQAVGLHVEVAGQTEVVEMIDAGVPIARFGSEAFGTGDLNIFAHVSSYILDMSSGQGDGTSVFVATTGDQLFGAFSIQWSAAATPDSVQIDGLTQFNGGTGVFAGASGSAAFSGIGQFISATAFQGSVIHDGTITLVPEPASAMLLLLGLGGLLTAATAKRRQA